RRRRPLHRRVRRAARRGTRRGGSRTGGPGGRVTEPVDRVVGGDGPALHAVDWRSSGASRPVLLLHGLASSARWWDLVAARLAAAGLGPVALDQRGHGQ